MNSLMGLQLLLAAWNCLAAPPPPWQANPSTQPSNWKLVNILYETGQVTPDTTTWTEGGVEGSAFLRVQYPRTPIHTDWVFLETTTPGGCLFVRILGTVWPETRACAPGEYIVSVPFGVHDGPFDYDKKLLSDQLVYVHDQGHPLHAPFLTGTGWGETTSGGRGAHHTEVQALASAFPLTVTVLGPNATGRVLQQFPAGGTRMDSASIAVIYDGHAYDMIPSAGLELNSAMAVDGDPAEGFFELTAKVLSEDPVRLKLPKGDGGPYRVWKLPPAASGKWVRVGRRDIGHRITLAAFTDGSQEPLARASGIDPELRFKAPNGAVYVVGALPAGMNGWLQLYAAWDADKRVDLVERARVRHERLKAPPRDLPGNK